MIEDELIKIWQSSSNQEHIKFEKSRLMIELQSSLERLHKWWKYQELLAWISVIIVILSFAFIVYHAPFITAKIASVLIIIVAVNVLINMLGIKKMKPSNLEKNYLEYLNKTKEYLEAQRNLFETSNYRVYLPFYPILFLFSLGFWEIPSKRYFIIMAYLMLIGAHIYSYFINNKIEKNEINPRIKKIDELIESLK